MAWYAARFAAMTGRGIGDTSETFRKAFRWLYQWAEDRSGEPGRKGFYLYGGTGCGKTTLARLFAGDGYRMETCLDVTADYEARNMNGIRSYYEGGVCFDDLGAEQKAYGKNAMEDVIQMRYDRRAAARRAHAAALGALMELEERRERAGWDPAELDDLDRCKAGRGEAEALAMCGWRIDRDNAQDKLASARARLEPTCITSNLDFEALGRRYGERVESRLREMCDFLDLSGEPDHRIGEEGGR